MLMYVVTQHSHTTIVKVLMMVPSKSLHFLSTIQNLLVGVLEFTNDKTQLNQKAFGITAGGKEEFLPSLRQF